MPRALPPCRGLPPWPSALLADHRFRRSRTTRKLLRLVSDEFVAHVLRQRVVHDVHPGRLLALGDVLAATQASHGLVRTDRSGRGMAGLPREVVPVGLVGGVTCRASSRNAEAMKWSKARPNSSKFTPPLPFCKPFGHTSDQPHCGRAGRRRITEKFKRLSV